MMRKIFLKLHCLYCGEIRRRPNGCGEIWWRCRSLPIHLHHIHLGPLPEDCPQLGLPPPRRRIQGTHIDPAHTRSPTSRTVRNQNFLQNLNPLRLGVQGSKQGKGLQRVKDTYESVADYLSVFEPLLFEEVKAQIVRGRSDEEEGGEGARTWAALLPCRSALFALILLVWLSTQIF